ncbi:MAG: hypothetical protein ACREJC_20585, partial [Tepidisphaeraceae bacterium]
LLSTSITDLRTGAGAGLLAILDPLRIGEFSANYYIHLTDVDPSSGGVLTLHLSAVVVPEPSMFLLCLAWSLMLRRRGYTR